MLKAAGEVISVAPELGVCPIVCLTPEYLTVAINHFF